MSLLNPLKTQPLIDQVLQSDVLASAQQRRKASRRVRLQFLFSILVQLLAIGAASTFPSWLPDVQVLLNAIGLGPG